MPPLRERREDLPVLIDYFMDKFAKENGKNIKGFTAEARDLLLKYDYPGNVRELENILERAVVIAREQYITTNDLPFKSDLLLEDSEKKSFSALRESLDDLEKKLIIESMEKTQDNQTKAADILGISERMLRYKLKKYGLKH